MTQLQGVEIFTVGPWTRQDFDNQTYPGWFHWTNTGAAKKFVGFDISMGGEGGSIQDFGVVLHDYTLADPIICQVGWDRYADPTGPITSHVSFPQGWFEIQPNSGIDLFVLYIPFSDNFISQKQVTVKIVGRYL
jgi:hypothetical protein